MPGEFPAGRRRRRRHLRRLSNSGTDDSLTPHAGDTATFDLHDSTVIQAG
ncbi:MAG TPA: hypothetical protein VNH40_09345 [Gaiellaceae bacterium]|nr:hypothetical protein [Gaiellaceae bacterium]